MDSSKTQSLVSDLIRFLQKWGLWEDTTILANGNRYSYSDMEISESLSVEDIESIWEQMVFDAKTEFIRECAADESDIISVPEIAGHIKTEFDKIFDRYGLWYDFGFSWSLTCYKKE